MRLLICFFFCLFPITFYGQNEFDLAESYFNNGDFNKAQYLFNKLHKSQPKNSKYVFRIIKIHQELEQFDAAELFIMNQFKNTNNPQYLVEIGYNYQLRNELDLAQDYYRQATSSAQNNPAYSYSIALRFEDHSLIEQAISVYKLVIQNTKNISYEYRLAGLYAQKRDIENMFISYLNFVEHNKAYLNQIFQVLSEYITEDSNSEYNLMFKKIVLKKLQTKSNVFWNHMLSWLYNQQNDYKKSLVQQISIYKRELRSLQGVIDVGILAKKAKDYETTITAFNFVIEMSQDSKLVMEAKLQLLMLDQLLKLRQVSEIENDYIFLIDLYGSKDNTLDLILSYVNFLVLDLDKKEKAIEIIIENLKQNFSIFSKARMKFKLADIYLAQKKFNLALLYYTQVYNQIKTENLAQEARFKAAKTSFYKGDFNWAESQLNILKSSTSKLIANDALDLKLLITDHKLGDGHELPLKLYAKADFYKFQNNYSESFNVLQELILNYPDNQIVDQALIFQAEILEFEEKYSEALKKYEEIIDNFPYEILVDDAYFAAAELCRVKLNLPNKAQKYYEKIIFEFQDSIHLVDSKKYFRSLRGSDY